MARTTCPNCGFAADEMGICPKCGVVLDSPSKLSPRTSKSEISANNGRPRPSPAQQYATSNAIGSIVAGLGWVAIAIAVIVLAVAASQGRQIGILALAPAAGIALGGLFLVVQGQLLQAAITTVNHLAQIRDSLSIQK